MRKYLALGVAAALCGCQSNIQYQKIGYGPDLAVADAQCNLVAMSAQQGYVAWGSDAYLAGAAIGNAIGNAITMSIVKKNCMVINGWGEAPKGKRYSALTPQQRKAIADSARRQRAEVAKAAGQKFPPAPQCSTCRS